MKLRPLLLVTLAVLVGLALGPVDLADPARAAERADDPVPWGVEVLHNASSMERTTGGDGVDVAVLDTGIDRDHPDLRGSIERCRNYTEPEVQVGACQDVDGHGTHVAGTVAADGGRDGEGLWGMAPEADIWAFKVCRDDGSCETERIGTAIRDAADLGAEVIVMSLGGQPDPFVQPALNRSLQQDVLPVAAAGNAGPNLSTIKYPAADRLAVGVAAVGRVEARESYGPDDLKVANFSSRGEAADAFRERDNLTEVAAPGFAVQSTAIGGGYSHLSGTSMAAPHVGGLAARLWEAVGDRDGDGKVRDDVREAIRARAATADITRGTHASEGYDPASGIGLPRLGQPTARIQATPGVALVDEIVTFEALAGGSSPIVTYEWDLEGDGEYEARSPVVSRAYDHAGNRTVSLRVTDDTGVTATATYDLQVHRPPTADFVADPDVPLAGADVRLDGSPSRDDSGPVAAYHWDLDGDGALEAEGEQVTTTFDALGPTPVTLEVTDRFGATDTATRSLLVNDAPRVTIQLPDDPVPDEEASLAADVVDEVGNVTVTWTLPGGVTRTGAAIEHAFAEGVHGIQVRAQDSHGAAGTAEGSFRVGGAGDAGPFGIPASGLLLAAAGLGVAARARSRR